MLLPGYLSFMCPGCEDRHVVKIGGEGGTGWNGDFFAPTINSPLLLEHCKSLVTDGRIYYLQGCAHRLDARIADLPVWEPDIE